MIKFAGTNEATGLPVLGIGLTREECDNVLNGKPILFNTGGMVGLQPMEVCIIGGEQAALAEALEAVRPADEEERLN